MSDEKKDPIADAFGMVPMSTSNQVSEIIAKAHSDSARDDFETARANIYKVIEGGVDALDQLGQIADQSQNPRAYEVYSTLMKTIVDANKDLLDIQKKIRDLSGADTPMNAAAKTINNNLFVGSTAELQKVIENLKNGRTE